MPTSSDKAKKAIEKILNKDSLGKLITQGKAITPEEKELPPPIPGGCNWSKDAQNRRIDFVKNTLGNSVPYLAGEKYLEDPEVLRGNIENYIGMAQIPTGLVGPLRIVGTEANGDFYVPLTTSEGALIASYNRGANIASLSGGVRSVCLTEAVQRTPSFTFESFIDVSIFFVWVMENIEIFKKVASEHTSHGKLEDIKANILGNQITLIFEYSTGDASGQNMVTICTYAVCKYIEENTPVIPQNWYIEGNLSGDKKASAISFTSVRGKKVIAEAVIKQELVEKILHTTPEKMMDYWKIAIVNGIQSGSIGVNGHFANGLAGIFLACGQDVATISEASVGITRFDLTSNNDLYISVTLPNLIVGTVGGGTGLPTQRECLEIMDCYGDGKARKFAEICAAAVLCGEISIIGAIVAGDFARAHKLYGRKKK
jgi:hydroxymethylglutaryl-CoA reductase (NADPH)